MKYTPVLMYHSVTRKPVKNDKYVVSRFVFRKQMNCLKEWGFSTVALKQIANAKWKEKLLAKQISITFDDGVLDCWENAYPLLTELGFGGVFFINPDSIGKPNAMTWEMIKEIASTPKMEIASHALMHHDLVKLSESDALRSLVSSKQILEDKLGRAVEGISYPFGLFNEKVLELAKKSGYLWGCAATHVHNKKLVGDPYCVRRIKISNSSRKKEQFLWRVSGFYHLGKT